MEWARLRSIPVGSIQANSCCKFTELEHDALKLNLHHQLAVPETYVLVLLPMGTIYRRTSKTLFNCSGSTMGSIA